MRGRKVCGPALLLGLGVGSRASWGGSEIAIPTAREDMALLVPSPVAVNAAKLRWIMNKAAGRDCDVYGSETLLFTCVTEGGFCWRPDLGANNQCYAGVYAGVTEEVFELLVSRGLFQFSDSRTIAKDRRELCVGCSR